MSCLLALRVSARKAPVCTIVLAASQWLARGQTEFHGHEIARHLAGTAERKLLTAHGTLYRALARLQQMGLVESRWEHPQIVARVEMAIRAYTPR